ncbi:hypothetical protein M422DRAFT_37952 [Sphaerobolus stellatus SS14]|uniref:Unplaced genomic scaffold SPHSTscaffold_272, whole genome shotgun sequence n=1 Tax=Sphaerobolus stellatus (strain SS14) TaxID=990650 RepID=A0A0C9UNN6_SPHS4|nr:hypothetical protein M422DRAFT_37952 [Sphaerobolus stellatus SS14]
MERSDYKQPLKVIKDGASDPRRLPREILLKIFEEGTRTALPCIVHGWPIDKGDWNDCARDTLYRGLVKLQTIYKTKLFLRTVSSFPSTCPVSHLHVNGPHGRMEGKARKESGTYISQLLPCCTKLQYLELYFVDLSLSPTKALPAFHSLRFIAIPVTSNFYDIAPLFSNTPNLEALKISGGGHSIIDRPPEIFPQPTFKLRELSLIGKNKLTHPQ